MRRASHDENTANPGANRQGLDYNVIFEPLDMARLCGAIRCHSVLVRHCPEVGDLLQTANIGTKKMDAGHGSADDKGAYLDRIT